MQGYLLGRPSDIDASTALVGTHLLAPR
jgi:hypothetical protein